ncbi:MAG: DJ-1/PfpI family protein [Pseudomonadota bacterium]
MRHVGALIFPGFEPLDLYGPLEMFGLMSKDYKLTLVAEHEGPVKSNPYVESVANTSFDRSPEFDMILVPGGPGTRSEVNNSAIIDWIAKASERTEHTLSVCTGSALLARSGILDGVRATTNKAAFSWVAEQGPKVKWIKQARWVEDGKFFTSSGVSAGMDMALGAIAHMHGMERAEEIATFAEYSWHRDKDDDPFARVHGLV